MKLKNSGKLFETVDFEFKKVMRIRIQGVICGALCVSLLMVVLALHLLSESNNNTKDGKSRIMLRGIERKRDAVLKGRGSFRYGPVEMGGPVNEASEEYLDTHYDMMPMMKAAPPMKTTMVSGIPDSHYPLPPPPPPPLPYIS